MESLFKVKIMDKKVCSKCKEEKEVCEFGKDSRYTSGFRSICKECNKVYSKKSYTLNRTKILEDKKNYYDNNKLNILNTHKKYRENNVEKIKTRDTNYKKNKRKTDILYKLRHNIRVRTKQYLSSENKTFESIGCSPEYLKEFIENQFNNGMSWENYGIYGWHIDHKTPLSSAKTEEEIYQLCHYTNLQPLWSEDNLKKSNKIL
jgi:hypothetical protein